MKTLEREAEIVGRILAALQDLMPGRRRAIIWRLASMYGRPPRWLCARRQHATRTKDPSRDFREGSFSMAQIVVLSSEELADAA